MIHREPEPKARPKKTEMKATGRVMDERSTPRMRMIHRPVHPHLMAFIDWASPAEVNSAHRVTMTRLMAIAMPVWEPCVASARSTLNGAVRSEGSRPVSRMMIQPPTAATRLVTRTWMIAWRRLRSASETITRIGVIRMMRPSAMLTGRMRIWRTSWKLRTSMVTPRVVALASAPIVQMKRIAIREMTTSTRSSRRRRTGRMRSAM